MKIAVAGAGPAGMAAACAAAQSGATVTIIDDNPATGGQIWRGGNTSWTQRLNHAKVDVWTGARVVSAAPYELVIERGDQVEPLTFDKLILATGARELFLPFFGWTTPGVFGAGGLQALAKSGFLIAGKRVIVAGTGPLLLAVAANLESHGAEVLLIAEQAPWAKLIRFGAGLPWPKQFEAWKLRHPKYSPGTWVTAAEGPGKLFRVTLQRGKHTWQAGCDYLAIGYGLAANSELAELFDIDPAGVDEFQQSRNPDIYCAGEITGIGGVDLAVTTGTIAGYAAAGEPEESMKYFAERARWTKFVRLLSETFALRDELRRLPAPDTTVCRCEDVSYSRVSQFGSWREAKLQTRCGMGACQGRVCGPALEFLKGWKEDSVRPPVFPARVGSLIVPKENEGDTGNQRAGV